MTAAVNGETKCRNVISFSNAGKRDFGDNHWFWAVWIEVGHSREWNQEPPSFSGHSTSKRQARRAAWDALRQHARLPVYSTGWAWWYLSWLRDQDTRSLYSRCTIGKNRWFWIVIEDLCGEPIAQGISRSSDDALAEAEQRCGSLRQVHATSAKAHWEKQRAMIRQQTTANGNDASPMQFVYRCYWDYSEYDSSQYEVIERHCIVKKTKKRIFVEDKAFDEHRAASGDWMDYAQSTFVLDRREFESTGKAKRSGRWRVHRTYYADPALFHAERGRSARPACLEVLDLPTDATIAQVKAAYRRLSRAMHPDAGGTDHDFVRMRENYEDALKLAAGRE